MEFVDNTGHLFSLPSFNEKPIGYEYEENDFVFWLNDDKQYRLSINNYYVKPIYFVYETDNPDDLDIEIYFNNTNVFNLLSPIVIQNRISNFESIDDAINFDSDSTIIKSRITNDDIYAVKIQETINDVDYSYSLFPLYVIGLTENEGTWLSNLMIHIKEGSQETWCPITIGGMFVDEYEELIINGQNMGISLPKDILKSIYSESIYNDEYNVELYNEKLKEYLVNYMGIRGELGNYNSVINSLKWFGYGDKISISKLLKTDNDVQTQYIRNYFHIEDDVLKSFKTFKLDSLVSLIIMTNKELNETYPIDFDREYLMGENKPKLLDLLKYYEKIKIGNHDMEIEDDPEKYFYWKPYFDFTFNELGIKLSCLKYYYKKYFLPIHLNIHVASLGERVFANDVKFHAYSNINMSHPLITNYNEDSDIEFTGNNLHYFTKQLHYIDNNFNELSLNYINKHPKETFYELNDTCINIPIKFKENKLYNCILILERQNYENFKFIHYVNHPIQLTLDYDHFDREFSYEWETIKFYNDNKEITSGIRYAYIYDNESLYSDYFDSYDELIKHAYEVVIKKGYHFDDEPKHITGNIYIKILCDIDKFDKITINDNEIFNIKTYLENACDCLLEKHFSFYLEENDYLNFILYPKKINIKNLTDSKYFEYWVNSNFVLKLCVNNKWYEYEFKTMINLPVLDFGRLKYKYYLNNVKSLIGDNKLTEDEFKHYLTFVNEYDFENLVDTESLQDINFDLNINSYETLYSLLGLNEDISLMVPIDENQNLYDTMIDYGNLSLFSQISKINEDKITFNSYMNDHSLINVNHINYDIDFYKILRYHLENNLHYLDGSLINDSFYRYIEYYVIIKKNDRRIDKFFEKPKNNVYGIECYLKEDNRYNKYFIKKVKDTYFIYDDKGEKIKEWEGIDEYLLKYDVYIHNDLVGKDIVINNTMLSNFGNNLLYANDAEVYILREIDSNSNTFEIMNSDYVIIGSEDETFGLLLEYKLFKYNAENDTYVIDDIEYDIYEKLYQNENEIYKKYSYNPNIINNDAYLNNIYMFGIYDRKYKTSNILQFNSDIDVRVNGVEFKNIGRSKYEVNDDNVINDYVYNDEFEISGPIYRNIIDSDTRYPDCYGLYWDNIFTDKNRYQYNFTNLLGIGYFSLIHDLTEDTWFDRDQRNVDVESIHHLVVEGLFKNMLVITYKDNRYTTYNNYEYPNASFNLTIYDSTKENIIGMAKGLVIQENCRKGIYMRITETNMNSLANQEVIIKKYYVDKNKMYTLYDSNGNELNLFVTVNESIEIGVEIDELNIRLNINNNIYEIYRGSVDDEYYQYRYSDTYIKPIKVVNTPAYIITVDDKAHTSFIIEKTNEGEYYQYVENNHVGYRKLLDENDDYYKYLYIQTEPYQYLNYSLYVQREYDGGTSYNNLVESEYNDDSIFTKEEYHYWVDSDNYTLLGTCQFKTLDDFYNGKYIEGTKTFKGDLRLDGTVYKVKDPSLYKINDNDPDYEYSLSYKVYAYENGEHVHLDIDNIIGNEYDYIEIEFYYNKMYLIKNKYYTLNEFIESEYIGGVRDRNGRYYVNDKVCYVQQEDIYSFNVDNNDYIIVKVDNKFYNNDNIINVSINDDILTYIIDDEHTIEVSLNDINIETKYYLIADDKKIEVIKVSNTTRYVDYYGNDIKIQNPSGYWYDLDNDRIKDLDQSLNELKRYWFIENTDIESGNSIEEIELQLNIYKNRLQNSLEYGLNMDNSIELRYRYKNYLSKELTGLKGVFEIDWDVEYSENSNNPEDLFNVCVCIDNGKIEVYNKKHDTFKLTGNENQVIVYFRLNTKDIDVENIEKFIAKPRILSVYEVNERLKYNYKESGEEFVVRIDNKEYKYGDNSSQYIIDLYNKFFKCKYKIYDVWIDEENHINKHLLHSIYESKLRLNNDAKYDFYLMHDNEYWYGLFISKKTCDVIHRDDIKIRENDKLLYIDDTLMIKYEKHAKQFLINRMYYVSANGYNHFNDDELICATLCNNDRLPIRADVSSKWNISGMSLGMDLKNEFESNAEKTIIGINKNDNKYQKGYYNVIVRYSIDRDLNHQFKNAGTFRVL